MDRKVIEYKILTGGVLDEKLELQVNKLIQTGWQPLGGLAASGNTKFQAMVRYE